MIQTSAPEPQPDPQLTAQLKSAQTAQEQAVRSSLSSDTLNIIRLFGQSNALSGAGITMPMASMVGTRSASAVGR